MNYSGPKTPARARDEQAARLRALLGEIMHCCQERMCAESAALGLPQAELRCLTLFAHERYVTAKDLAAKMNLGKSRVAKILAGLMEKGLVRDRPDPVDARIKLLSLTEAGLERLAEAEAYLSEIHRRVLEQMEPRQRSSTLAALELLWSAMQTVKSEANVS